MTYSLVPMGGKILCFVLHDGEVSLFVTPMSSILTFMYCDFDVKCSDLVITQKLSWGLTCFTKVQGGRELRIIRI